MPGPPLEALRLRETPEGTELPVRVTPKAGRSAVRGLWREALRVQVAAAPEGGRANEELCAFLAGLFGIPRRAVRIARGERCRDKLVLLSGIGGEKVRAVLAELIEGGRLTEDQR